MSTRGLAEILFGAYRRKVLTLLLLRADEALHVREISRLAGVPAGSLHRELKLLAGGGLLVRDEVGNQVRYQANRDCPIFEELAAIFRKTSGLADVLKDALCPLSSKIDLAFIFGSVAQGRETARSDVDVLIVGSASFVEVVQALAPTQERLGREVNPAVMTRNMFVRNLAEGDSFIKRIAEEPKIYLRGNDDDLGKLAEHRPTENPHPEQR
jgi:predicted nucleotidyltransferase